ncbi:MAG: response regulator, partial [Thermoanaerobaculum sp.]|nr:response regulator [Thermoanaerobaculum sp.]
QGSTFTVILPRAAGQTVPGPAGASPPALHQGKGRRILLVEDEGPAREALAQALGLLGYEVVAVGSAEEALQLPPEPPFDVLLTDFLLPGATGAQLAAELVSRWPQLKLIVMSGYAEDAKFLAEVGEGKVHFLQKPFTIEQLAAALGRELEQA